MSEGKLNGYVARIVSISDGMQVGLVFVRAACPTAADVEVRKQLEDMGMWTTELVIEVQQPDFKE